MSFACYLIHTGFLLGLFFGPDNGGDIFLRNIDRLSTDLRTAPEEYLYFRGQATNEPRCHSGDNSSVMLDKFSISRNQ
jgi:hypothetical protein